MKTHWTNRSNKDYRFKIVADFLSQIEDHMDEHGISQTVLAKNLRVTKGRVSQIFNTPGNTTIETLLKIAKAVNLKISIVAYDDDDRKNEQGPIHSKLFEQCWKKQGSPKDFWR